MHERIPSAVAGPDVNEMDLSPVELESVGKYGGIGKKLVAPRMTTMLVSVDHVPGWPSPHPTE